MKLTMLLLTLKKRKKKKRTNNNATIEKINYDRKKSARVATRNRAKIEA